MVGFWRAIYWHLNWDYVSNNEIYADAKILRQRHLVLEQIKHTKNKSIILKKTRNIKKYVDNVKCIYVDTTDSDEDDDDDVNIHTIC